MQRKALLILALSSTSKSGKGNEFSTVYRNNKGRAVDSLKTYMGIGQNVRGSRKCRHGVLTSFYFTVFFYSSHQRISQAQLLRTALGDIL